MVVVATRNDAAMDLTNQRLVDRPIRFKLGNPTISRQRASRLALRSSLQLLRRLPHRRVQFSFRELRAFYPRCPRHLPLELRLQVGQQVEQAAEMGFIKFGSRVDLLLPVNTKVNVELNQVVRGGITVIATL